MLSTDVPAKNTLNVNGHSMAYVDRGRGDTVVLDGEPADVHDIVAEYAAWMGGNAIPKLFINADPGAILIGPARETCRSWHNQAEVTVPGSHFIQEDAPQAIGEALADWYRNLP